MARTPLIFDSLDMNDGMVYRLFPGVELGARLKTWNSRKSYTGNLAQYNVSEAQEIPMKFPLKVQGTSLADLDAKVQAINAKIDGCGSADPKDLVFASTVYQITTTPRVAYSPDAAVFTAMFDLVLNRVPDDPTAFTVPGPSM